MLENIKFLLNLTDDKHDKLLLFYIKRFENLVLDYCNLTELNPTLEGFIEDRVINVVGPKVKSNDEADTPNSNNNNIKAITRGDTRIEYNVSEKATNSDILLEEATLTTSDMKILNLHRKLRR